MLKISAHRKEIKMKLPYSYARSKDETCLVFRVKITDGTHVGWGEGGAFESFFEQSLDHEFEMLEAVVQKIQPQDLKAENLPSLLPPGPALNALDAALWDYKAKKSGRPIWALLNIQEPKPVKIMFTISMAEEKQLRQEILDSQNFPILKVKLGSDNDVERLELVRKLRPDADIVVDVNGRWDVKKLQSIMPILEEFKIKMIEQPLPKDNDAELRNVIRTIPIIADESFSTINDLDRLEPLYDGVNIKLDKCGGLTQALEIVKEARKRNMRIMVGCLPATSLSSAVGIIAAQFAEFVDLDNQFWVPDNFFPPLVYQDKCLFPPTSKLWG